MALALRHGYYMMGRELLALWRQPWWIAITHMQPIIWLLLFGAMFERVVDLPGFASDDYIQYLTPGVVVMTAFFSASWSGMGMINDLDKGVTDRMLVSPVARSALIAGKVMQGGIVVTIQSAIMVGLALALGATFPGGVGGVVLMVALSVLLGASVGAFSNGLGLLVRREETLIAILSAFQLPLTFLSTAFMAKDLMPGWMQTISEVNPLNWAIEASRSAVLDGTDWGFVLSRAGLLVLLLGAASVFAVRAFRSYQRSV